MQKHSAQQPDNEARGGQSASWFSQPRNLAPWAAALALLAAAVTVAGVPAAARAGDAATQASRVLVLGGTGRLGNEIIRRLRPQEHDITVFARPTSNRDRLQGLQVDFVVGDLLDKPSVVTALAGRPFDYVIDASARRNYAGVFYEIAMTNVLAAVEAENVKQFILHGSIGAGDSAAVFSDELYGRMRGIMQDKTAAEQLLRASGIPYTIIRNGIIKPYDTPPTGTAMLTEDTRAMGAVTRQDLADLTLQCLGAAACLNQTLHAIDPSWAND